MNCPICNATGGFHLDTIHKKIEVPRHLTWKPGDVPLWKRELPFP